MFRLLLRNKPKAGFTLIELLIYMAVFAIAVGLLSGILVTFTRVQGRESASAEVTQQLAFVQTTIQRLVERSGQYRKPARIFLLLSLYAWLPPSSDPTIISSDADGIYLKQGLTGSRQSPDQQSSQGGQFSGCQIRKPRRSCHRSTGFLSLYNSQRVYQQITRGSKPPSAGSPPPLLTTVFCPIPQTLLLSEILPIPGNLLLFPSCLIWAS